MQLAAATCASDLLRGLCGCCSLCSPLRVFMITRTVCQARARVPQCQRDRVRVCPHGFPAEPSVAVFWERRQVCHSMA
eukprot:3863462-Alexandrium_andersonii.AAC.1